MRDYRKSPGYAASELPTLGQEYGNAVYFIPVAWIFGVFFGITYMLNFYT